MQKYFALIGLLFLPIFTLAFTVPARPSMYVNDYAGMLSADQASQLETKIESFEKSTTNEIAVVTVQSLNGEPIENVAQGIFTKWGIGKKDKNNGVLLLISLSDRKTRIQTGYGVEGNLTDIATSYIQRDIITPAFRSGDYYSGINGAVDKMISALGGSDIVPDSYNTAQSNNYRGFNWQFIFIFGFVAIQWIIAILARSKSWWGGGFVGGVISLILWYFFISSIIFAIPLFVILVGFGLLLDFHVSRAYSNYKTTGIHPPWFLGGGGLGGGTGGGFGGFGGGGSGGGGASGSW